MRRIATAITALLMVLTACSSSAEPSQSVTSAPTRGATKIAGSGTRGAATGTGVFAVQGALQRFRACEDFLTHVKAEALELVGPYGLGFGGIHFDGFLRQEIPVSALATEDAIGAGGYSQTNNQEAGVDEPDVVKTDGRRIVALIYGKLNVIDVTGPEPVLLGSVTVDDNVFVRDLFLHGDKVILMGESWTPIRPLSAGVSAEELSSDALVVEPYPYPSGSPIVTLTEVDISADPEITGMLQLDGSYISSRLVDGIARAVITSGPTGFEWVFPKADGLRAEREATEANRRLIEESTIENWVPYAVLTNPDGGVISEGPAVACERAHYPEEPAGINMLSVLTFDLDSGLAIVDSTGVLATGETVYSSVDSLYVAVNQYAATPIGVAAILDDDEELRESRTQIHQFDVSGRSTDYVATGSIRGYLLNQFAMSEHGGDLRVASTTFPNWWGDPTEQESLVTVLRPEGAVLETIGLVDGLGRGEQIYSARFLGDVAYLVTFRQIDPLFTIDLRDPREPEVRGELKIPGYSSYLHPISETLVLGIGQDATNGGRIQGSQVSLFDVSDLDDPTRLDKLAFGDGTNSTAEHDHKAFLQWGDLVVVPMTEYRWDGKSDGFTTGAVAIEIGTETLTEVGRVMHPGGDGWHHGWEASIIRSLVIDDSLYTVSNRGLMKSDLASLSELAWLELR